MQPFLTIIIPTLNEELFLPKLLGDLQKQTKKNFEVCIVDSASKDKTKELALPFKKALPLYFFENQKRNVSIQRNFGAKRGKGKYLVFLDADTRVEPSFARKLENAIRKKKGLLFFPRFKTDDPNTETQFVMDVVNLFFIISQNLDRPFALGAAMIFEKNYFFTLNGFDERLSFGEDYEITRRSFKWGVKAKFLSDVSAMYSLRRIRKEGKLLAYYKFFLSTAQYLIKGKTERKLFDYEMGGHLYKEVEGKKMLTIDALKKALKKAKKIFVKILNE